MAPSVLVPLADYLKTSYRPDREYVDGEVLERTGGEWEHARTLSLLTGWFCQHEQKWGIQTAIKWRTQVSATRVRIPDVVAATAGAQPDVLATPPLLVVETLSPDDSYSDTQRRAADYVQNGHPDHLDHRPGDPDGPGVFRPHLD